MFYETEIRLLAIIIIVSARRRVSLEIKLLASSINLESYLIETYSVE